MMTTETTIWTVWLNQARKIASFHAIDGYIRYDFRDHGHFLHYCRNCRTEGISSSSRMRLCSPGLPGSPEKDIDKPGTLV